MRCSVIYPIIFVGPMFAFWHHPKYIFYKKKPEIFPLAHLPVDLQNYIATFLPLRIEQPESNEDFISRLIIGRAYTWEQSALRGQLQIFVPRAVYPQIFQKFGHQIKRIWELPSKDTLNGANYMFVKCFAFTCDLSKFAIIVGSLWSYLHIKYSERLYFYDCLTKTQTSYTLHSWTRNPLKTDNNKLIKLRELREKRRRITTELLNKKSHCIAISNSGTVIAIANSYIINFYRPTEKRLELLDDLHHGYFCIDYMEFSKDELALGLNGGLSHCDITSLPSSVANKNAIVSVAAEKRMEYYFRQRGVCKKWPQAKEAK